MECENQMDSSKKATTGANLRSSATGNGLCRITPRSAEAPETLRQSLVSRMRLFCFGFVSMKSNAEQYLKRARLSTGDWKVRTTQCGTGAASLTQCGAAVSARNAKCFTPATSGRPRVRLFGSGIWPCAKGAKCTETTHRTCPSISTTSYPLLIRLFVQSRRILCCFAKRATGLFTQGGM